MNAFSKKLLVQLAVLTMVVSAQSASAEGIFDFVKTKTESGDTYLVYDFNGYTGSQAELKNVVTEALSYHGDRAFVKDNLITGEVPRYPGKLTLKPLAMNLPVSFTIPNCEGSSFTVSSSDNSMARGGETASYMACGFAYQGGFRVNFYSHFNKTSGGAAGLLSGMTIAKVITRAVGLNTDPQDFIEASIKKMEELFEKNGWVYQIVEMQPQLKGKTVSPDPIQVKQASEVKRGSDRGKRMAARAELNKLGMDASDRARFQKAIQQSDEDLVALFAEAGAVDLASKDSDGKLLSDYASKPTIRELLNK
jgi:hypothetical protein